MKTIRQQIMILLCEEEMSAREISRATGIREKEVYEHLSHIARSAAGQGKKLIVGPFSCLSCGYVFQDRKRFNRPSRCPQCKGSHMEEPMYRIH